MAPSLPELQRHTLVVLERAYNAEGVGANRIPTLELWANLLRVLEGDGIPVRKFSAALRLWRRALRSRLALGVRQGWVEPARASVRQARIGGPKLASARVEHGAGGTVSQPPVSSLASQALVAVAMSYEDLWLAPLPLRGPV